MLAQRRIGTLGSLAFLNAFLLASAVPAYAQIESVVVTAQKKAEDIQTVPIAITAFTADDLTAHQINSFNDLQFSVPGVTYTKSNFTGSDFEIRGIGDSAVGVSADDGVATNINDVYLNVPALAETEYFDIERVEVLRGPQSTLYGRNATGGATNVITAKPDTDSFALNAEGEYGNFSDEKVKGMVNIPLIDGKLALRIAGLYWSRGGTTTNTFDNSHIDDRNQYATRASLRWTPSENTTIDVVADYSLEASTRMRSQKQACERDSSGVLGCLPGALTTDTTNTNADFQQILASSQGLAAVYTGLVAPVLSPAQLAGYQGATNLLIGAHLLPAGSTPAALFGALGLFDLTNPGANLANPPGLHTVNMDINPLYHAHQTFIDTQWKQRLNDWLDMTLLLGYQQASNSSQQSYMGTTGETIGLTPTQRAIWSALDPTIYNTYLAGAGLPVSAFDSGNSGIIGGHVRTLSTNNDGYDLSGGTTNQKSVEWRFSSNLDGPLNFLLAAYYLDDSITNDYRIATPALDYDAIVYGAMLSGFQPVLIGPSTYRNNTAEYYLNSKALFGELYYDAIPSVLKFTGGLRYTEDSKKTVSRTTLLNAVVPAGTANLDTPVPYITTAPLGGFQGPAEFTTLQLHNQAWTGRFVVDYTPKIDFTDETLIYASYSRGYKAGGMNPPLPTNAPAGTPQYFAPEFINAYELGTKNTLLGGMLQANLTAWYYDYKGLQVSSIVNKTSINQNIDATLYGFEGELLWAPSDNWQFNLSTANTNSSIGNSAVVDTRDPTGGNPNVLLVKDISSGANCVISVVPGTPFSATAQAELPLLAAIPKTVSGFANPAGYGSCASDASGHPTFLAGTPLAGLAPLYVVSSGVAKSLKGNSFQNSPNLTFGLGGQYSFTFDNGYKLVPRLDMYWQSNMYGTIFNDPVDKIKSFVVVNGQIQLNSPNSRWYARAFINNAFDEQYVTGMYVTDASTGLFTNEFAGEPRTFGLVVGTNF
jgi:outer membrane receptor protein involved in Fe transport